jgi:hypothetical protein
MHQTMPQVEIVANNPEILAGLIHLPFTRVPFVLKCHEKLRTMELMPA